MSLLLEALKKAAQEKQAQQQRGDGSDESTRGGHRAGSQALSLEPVAERGSLEEPDTAAQTEPSLEPDAELRLEGEGSAVEPASAGTPYERPLAVEPPDARKGSILPRMQGPEPAAALSPEAARRVFESKRSGSTPRTRLFVLGGFGVVVLMAVVLSLFYYSSQVSSLDQQITTFRREPRALAPPPPRSATPDESPSSQAAGPGTESAGGDRGDVSAGAAPSRPPIIDQVEEGVVAASEAATETGDVSDEPDTAPAGGRQKPARAASARAGEAPGGLRVESRRTGSVRVTSGSQASVPDARGAASGEEIVVRSRSRILDADQLLVEAYEAYRAGDLQRAELAYGAVLRSRPDDRDALLGLAAIQQRRGSSTGAIAIYRRLLELNPKDTVARSALMELNAAQGGLGETDLKLMLRDQPRAPHLHFALGNLYAARGRWSQAQGAYFDAYRLAPDNADYAYNLAVSLDQLDKPGVARRYYEQALVSARNGASVSFSPQGVARRLQVIGDTVQEP